MQDCLCSCRTIGCLNWAKRNPPSCSVCLTLSAICAKPLPLESGARWRPWPSMTSTNTRPPSSARLRLGWTRISNPEGDSLSPQIPSTSPPSISNRLNQLINGHVTLCRNPFSWPLKSQPTRWKPRQSTMPSEWSRRQGEGWSVQEFTTKQRPSGPNRVLLSCRTRAPSWRPWGRPRRMHQPAWLRHTSRQSTWSPRPVCAQRPMLSN
eukprot:Lithocolla_globosa_v1_NODE_903_length_3103_cov_38.322507.p2 type:complete len:208 gc:universal NODE_903_length_3103_cov_38.322507:1988-2611(+)